MRSLILRNRLLSLMPDPLIAPCGRTFLTAMAFLGAVVSFPGCSRPALQVAPATTAHLTPAPVAQPAPGQRARTIRATGLIRALESQSLRVPQLSGTGLRLTVMRIIANGSKVSKDDILAQFDPTSLLDAERDAQAKLDDLSHQLDQKKAQVSSDDAGRVSQIR